MTKRFVPDAGGRVQELHTVQVEQAQEPGRMVFREIPGSEQARPAQLVLLAMGFLGPEPGLLQQLGLEQGERSNIRASHTRFASGQLPYETSVSGVFAAGDARRGQSLVVWAVNEGRGAALACDRYLMRYSRSGVPPL